MHVDPVDVKSPLIDEYHDLVSETNWDKGEIIARWMSQNSRTGEDFARIVEGITGLHADRLARVSNRFGYIRLQLTSLRFSHFHAAVDWHDAVHWLKLADANSWTARDMRMEKFREATCHDDVCSS